MTCHLHLVSFCYLPSFFHKILPDGYKTLPMYHHFITQPHTSSGPSPVFVVCDCLNEVEGEDQQSDHCICFQSFLPDLPSPLLASSCPPILSSPLLCVCLFFPCPPNCPLDFLFVYLSACLSVAWQPAKTILQPMPITPWETTSNIL